jgi:hypothetical protein
MKKYFLVLLCATVCACVGLAVIVLPSQTNAGLAAVVGSLFSYNFAITGIVNEVSPMDSSSSPYWWVNSGGELRLSENRGWTVQGELPQGSKWRLLYAANNPTDTDNGYHPQNIFRLVSRSQWENFRQEAYFMITNNNLSSSSNRNASNGLLLFNRYKDGNNLYYTGVRVDGAAVIKKKKNGAYTTLAYVRGIYPGTYNESSSPNLMPKNEWLGIRSEVKTLSDGAVNIKVFIDKGWRGQWELVAEATDRNSPVLGKGYGGIRTDFMDVKFDNYKISEFAN